VIRIFEDIAAAGVIARNAQEKSQLGDLLLWMRGEMFRVVDAVPAGFATWLSGENFFGGPMVRLRYDRLFRADIGTKGYPGE